MGKWKKSNKGLRKDFKEIKWDNIYGGESVSVVYDGERWRVWLHDVTGYDEELKKVGFNSKGEAVKFAMGWMSRN